MAAASSNCRAPPKATPSAARNSTRCSRSPRRAAPSWSRTSAPRSPAERSDVQRLVLASSNRGKLAELQPLLSGAGYELVTQGELGVDDAIEDGHSFVENALIKARHACRAT